MYKRFESTSYILNKDFSIKIKLFGKQKIALVVGGNDNFFVEPIVTGNQGICYKIDPKFKISISTSVTLRLHLNDSITEKPSHLVVYLTSSDATLNLATDTWPHFFPGEIKLPLDDTKKITVIHYQTIEYLFKTGVENSSDCVTKIIKKIKMQK